MLYTVLPIELVLHGIEEMENDFIEIEVDNIKMQVRMCEDNQAEIIRVIDSDPRTYLNPSFQPGRKIIFRPKVEKVL